MNLRIMFYGELESMAPNILLIIVIIVFYVYFILLDSTWLCEIPQQKISSH